jgi:hypothetical protein
MIEREKAANQGRFIMVQTLQCNLFYRLINLIE